MEVNRKSFAEESHLVLRKQQQTIEKLRKENETLKADVSNLQTRTTLKPICSFEQAQLDKLYTDLERFTRQNDLEKSRSASMEKQISSLREKVWRRRRSMGGINAASDNQRIVEKQVKILENRLDQALVRFNKSLSYNRKLRETIDDLRGERVSFDGVHKKLEKELQEKKKKMAKVIEHSNLAYEQRDRAQLEITAIEQANRKEQDAFEQQMTELGNILEREILSTSVKRNKLLTQPSPEEEEKRMADRKEAARANEIAREKQACAQQRKERMQNFEEAFRKIAAATGISDVDELVTAFVANEEQNFSLFTYANEQANDVDKLESQVKELKEEESRYARESGDDADQYEQILKELNDKIKSSQSQIEKYEQKYDDSRRTLDGLKDEIKTMLVRLDCKNDMPGGSSVTDANMLHFLGLIEQRTNEILSMYHKMNTRNDGQSSVSLSATDLIIQKTGGQETSEEDRGGPILPRSSILGIGPCVPMGSEPIHVNPPKLADYSSDENSGGEEGGDVGLSSAPRPLRRDEIKNKTAEGVRRKAGGGVVTKKGNNGGRRRASLLALSATMSANASSRRGSITLDAIP